MYYLSLVFFIIFWLIVLDNAIKRIDMRIEMRERRLVKNEQGIHEIGVKQVENGKRSKKVKSTKLIKWAIPRYNYEPFPYIMYKQYSGQRNDNEFYLTTIVISCIHYIVGIVLFFWGLIIKGFKLPFIFLILECLFLALIELYYVMKK